MNETKTNQEFLLEVVKTSIDFNSNVLSVLTVEISGDQSGKNRTHQKKVLEDLRNMGYVYSANLDAMYNAHQTRVDGPRSYDDIKDESISHLEKTRAFLDARMAKNPNSQLATAVNYLADLLDEEAKKAEVTEEVNS